MATKFLSDQEFVNTVLLRFAEEVVKTRVQNIKDTKSIASAGLLRSHAFQIRKATVQQTAKAIFAFQEHGRFLDMKRIDTSKQRPVEEIKEWIKDKGLNAFRYLPESSGDNPIGQDRLLNDLAWGIVKKKMKKKSKRRRLQKGFEGLLEDLIVELMEGYQDRTIDQIKESLNNRLQS